MHTKVKNALSSAGIKYKVLHHSDCDMPINSPNDFAIALNCSIERITKSVFLKSKNGDKYIMAVCSSNRKMDFNIIRGIVGCGKVIVASVDDLNNLVGYPITGVSPLGLSENTSVLIDEALLRQQSILIGSGSIGIEIEINPYDLITITGAKVSTIVTHI